MRTVDIERLNESLKREVRYLMTLTRTRPDPTVGVPSPYVPMPDPGTGPGFRRRSQAKHDHEFWLTQRERLLDKLGEQIANGSVTI